MIRDEKKCDGILEFCDNSNSSRVENELKPIELLITDVEMMRVTVVLV